MFNVDEILFGVAQNSSKDILYTLDELSSASIEINAESIDITDKNGNVVRTIYTSKNGTFNSTNAFLHPQIMNAASGNKIEVATASAPIQAPQIRVIAPGVTINLTGLVGDTVEVIGIYGNGANSEAQKVSIPSGTTTYTAPAAEVGAPVEYLVKYERDMTDGWKLTNDVKSFPNAIELTLYCSYVDPCEKDGLKPMYVVLPNFTVDPSVTISLDRENQELDYNGNLNVDYCGADKALYYIYFPEDGFVTKGVIKVDDSVSGDTTVTEPDGE